MNPVFKTNADSAATLILDGDEYPVGEILIRNESFDFEGWTYESTIDNRDCSKVYSIKSADQKGYVMKYIKGSEASVKEISNEIKVHERASKIHIAPKIVAAFTFEIGGIIIMENVGVNLADYIVQRATVEECPMIFIEILALVGKMHDSHIYHRDFGIDNLTYNGDGRIYVIDFGMSTIKDDEHYDLIRHDHGSLYDSITDKYAGFNSSAMTMLHDMACKYYHTRFDARRP